MCSNYVTVTHWIPVYLLSNNVVFEFKNYFIKGLIFLIYYMYDFTTNK